MSDGNWTNDSLRAHRHPLRDDESEVSRTFDTLDGRIDTGVLRQRLVADGIAKEASQADLEARRIRLLYEQLPTSLLATVLTGGLMVVLLYVFTSDPAALWPPVMWLAAAVLVCAVRYAHAREVLRESSIARARQREMVGVCGAFVAGTLWAIVPAITPNDVELLYWLPLFLMIGMLAGATGAYAASLLCFAAFAAPIVIGLVVAVLFRGGDQAVPVSIMVLLFSGLMTLYMVQTNASLRRSLTLRTENRQLLVNLNRNNKRLKNLNASLEQQVEARTEQLRSMNATLRKDIDGRERAETALRESEMRFRALYDDSPAMSFMLRPSGEVISVNACAAQELGLPAAAIVGRPWAEFVFAPYRDAARRRLQACLDAPGTAGYSDLQVLRGDGSTLWLRVAARALRTLKGGLELLVTCQDVTDARLLSEQLGYYASHDTLTGLLNRRAFEDRVRRVVQTAGEQSSEHAVCYLDLDHFKLVNDQGGHAAGDELLRQLGRVMREQVRRRDTLARLGGDEFGLLMEHCSIDQAMRIATAMRDLVRDHEFHWEGATFKVGASVGVASLSARLGSLDEVLRRADAACYSAKQAGRNRVVLYDESQGAGTATQDSPWLEALEHAIAEARFVLMAQPIAAADGGDTNVVMAELQLRYRADNGDLVAPDAFIGAAERYDMASDIDHWVIDEALGFLRDAGTAGRRIDTLFVSLSSRSLADAQFAARIESSLKRTQADASRLCFEVPESAAIVSFNEVRDVMRRLRALGCRFALDDFGSGLSSLAQLRALPVDFVRLDGGFSRDVNDNALQAAMIRSVTDVSHVMNKRIIAAGVNDHGTSLRLGSLGVDYLQGHAIGPPAPLAQWWSEQDRGTASVVRMPSRRS